MAYCVHCGVKLDDAETRCPLCGIEAFDPLSPRAQDIPKPYPARTPEQTLMMNRKYAISMLSLLLLIPAGLCLLLDLLGGGVSWSIYPSGILVLCWITVIVPLLMRKRRTYSTIFVAGTTLSGYLFMIERLSNAPGWFFPIVLPALALSLAMICFTIALVRKWKVRALAVFAAALAQVGALCLAVEVLCARHAGGQALSWSPYVITPCVFFALLMYLIGRDRLLYEEFRRRFHF